jgi:hypothetical protein
LWRDIQQLIEKLFVLGGDIEARKLVFRFRFFAIIFLVSTAKLYYILSFNFVLAAILNSVLVFIFVF